MNFCQKTPIIIPRVHNSIWTLSHAMFMCCLTPIHTYITINLWLVLYERLPEELQFWCLWDRNPVLYQNKNSVVGHKYNGYIPSLQVHILKLHIFRYGRARGPPWLLSMIWNLAKICLYSRDSCLPNKESIFTTWLEIHGAHYISYIRTVNIASLQISYLSIL